MGECVSGTLESALMAACADVGIVYKSVPADGQFHQTDIEGDRHGKGDGRIKIFPDGEGGIVCNWKGESKPFFADDGRSLTDAERRERDRRRQEAIRKAREDDARRQAKAAMNAVEISKASEPATDQHPYLVRKGVKAHGARLYKGALAIPMRDGGAIQSLQFIGEDGVKRFLTDGRTKGCYFSIGKPDAVLCIAEGFATAASIHEATGYAVAVAFNAGNLEPVAWAMHKRFPALKLIICADDDSGTAGNPGITKATEAARAVGGLLAVPDFDTDRPEGATDFNDMAAQYGLEAVKRAIEGAIAPGQRHDAGNQADGLHAISLDLIRGSDVKPEPVSWLWNGWLAAGKMHVLGGAPGTGKTTISMALAATMTIGGRWPDGTRSPSGNVVIWSGEDDPADTLVPRLALSGADLSRVYFISDVRQGNERRSFDPAKDMDVLRRRLAEVGDVRLLIVDPIVSAIAGDSHKNAEVRRGLQPLSDLAASMRCALLGITHFSKGTGGRDPVERLTGSLAFGALARVVLVAAKHQEEGEDGRTVRLLLRAKSNIGPDDGGFEYDLQQSEMTTHPGIFASAVQWGQAVEGAARELLATADASGDDGEGGTLTDAKGFLVETLGNGPVRAKCIKADAEGAGYSWATIRRAKKALGIEPFKAGMKGGWEWGLPAKVLKNPEDAQQKEVSTFDNSEHLRTGHDVVEVDV